jgi:hypothetical protein
MGLVAFFLGATQGISQMDGVGRPGGGMDPTKFFDNFSKGQDIWLRSEMEPHLQPLFDRIAERMGVTDGKITREQFIKSSNSLKKRMAEKGVLPPGFSKGTLSDVSPEKPAGNLLTNSNALDARAEEVFIGQAITDRNQTRSSGPWQTLATTPSGDGLSLRQPAQGIAKLVQAAGYQQGCPSGAL